MKLLVIHDALTRGGAETYTLGVVRELVAGGDEVLVWTNLPPFAAELREAGARVDSLPRYGYWLSGRRALAGFLWQLPFRRFRFRRRLRRLARQGWRAVYLSVLPDKILLTDLAAKAGFKVFWVEYAPLSTQLRLYRGLIGRLYRRQLPHVSRVFTISRHSQDVLVAEGSVPADKLVLTYAGATPPAEEAALLAKRAAHLRRRYGNKLVVNISRLAPQKGQDVLIDAMATVVKKYPDAKLLLSGEPLPGEEQLRQDLADRVTRLRLQDNVVFLGFFADKWALLAAADVFVFPSAWEMEGFGIVSVEAMIMGKPVVGCQAGPVPEIVADGETGLLGPPHDAGEMAQHIIRLLGDAKLREQLGAAGQKRAADRFTDRQVAEITRRVIQEEIGAS